MRRRDFLALGSLAVVSQLVPGFVTKAFAQTAEPIVRPMSVGYILGSDRIRDLKRLPRKIRRPSAPVAAETEDSDPFFAVSAASIPLGNTELVGRPLRLTIHGLYPPAALTAKRQAELPQIAELEVVYPVEDPIAPPRAPFFAWSLRRDRHGVSISPRVRFTFPLDWQVLPELALKVVPAHGGPPSVFVTRFTLDDEDGLPRLQRGVYLLGLDPGTWDRAEVSLPELARRAPSKAFSILLSVDTEPEENP